VCLYNNLVKNPRFEDKFSNESRIIAFGGADPIKNMVCMGYQHKLILVVIWDIIYCGITLSVAR
jgi:hypothetical protein